MESMRATMIYFFSLPWRLSPKNFFAIKAATSMIVSQGKLISNVRYAIKIIAVVVSL